MASCELTIELDDPHAVRVGGQPVSGTVVVTTSEAVNCKGLEVTSYWTTHGRGNVASGDVDECVLFQGTWEPQKEYRYPFSLKTATWPPTYYGTYLNVSHLVRARARVPWSSDPKTSAEFPLVVTSAPDDLKPTVAEKKPSRGIGWILGWILGGVLLVLLVMFGAILLLLVPIIAIAGGCYWFFRVFLPSQLTGAIELTFDPKRPAAGDVLRGKLNFTPKRSFNINAIEWTVTCIEQCTSGSGTDQRTERHELLKHKEKVATDLALTAGNSQSFEFSFKVPTNAPPSLKFTSNELIWSAEVRIDIPKWPDYVKNCPLTVVPAADSAIPPTGHLMSATPGADQGLLPNVEEETWFREVLKQVLSNCDDAARLQAVLDAVREQEFMIRVNLQEAIEEPPPEFGTEEGVWMFAEHSPTSTDLCLFWPSSLTPPQEYSANWCGKAMILGYNDDYDSVLMRVVPIPS